MKKIIPIILLWLLLHPGDTFTLPPNDFEPWRMYAVYEIGYDTGQLVLDGVFGKVSLLQGCIEHSDFPDWKGMGWDNKTIRKAEMLCFYGCINTKNKKMSKKEFMNNMFKSMMEHMP